MNRKNRILKNDWLLEEEEESWPEAVEEAESALQGKGRVLLRPSGTEPVVRVMVEAPSVEEAQRLADSIADVVRVDLALG